MTKAIPRVLAITTHLKTVSLVTTLVCSAVSASCNLRRPAISDAVDRPVQIGSRKQLFIDHRFIDEKQNVSLRVKPPEKLPEYVLKSEHPWEAFGFAYFSVIQDGEKFRMWYAAYEVPHWWGDTSRLCYAESEDGRNWVKPKLCLVEYRGSKDNNIVIDPGPDLRIHARLAQVFKDPHDADESQRYKMLYGYGRTRMRTSPDGFHWREPGEIVWDYEFDTQKQAWWDEDLEKYVIYVRAQVKEDTTDTSKLTFPFVEPIPSDPPVVAPKLYRRIRMLARLETDDILKTWPSEVCRTILCGDELDPPNADIYHPGGVYKYAYADDSYFMFPWVYDQWPHSPNHNDGVIEAQLAASRDGWHWMRYDRKPYIPRGKEGEFDYGCAEPLGPFFRDGEYLYQYYTGWKWTHGAGRFERGTPESRDPENWGWKGIRLNRYRLDRFVGITTGETEGRLVTPPIVFDGERLEINLDAKQGGYARVEIQDEDGRPWPGFTLEDCKPIVGDAVAHAVEWKEGADVSALASHPVRLAITLRSAALYAFQFR